MATMEKALGLVNSLLDDDRIKELGLVVVDEVHMVGEAGGRGATLENLITTLRYTARTFFFAYWVKGFSVYFTFLMLSIYICPLTACVDCLDR